MPNSAYLFRMKNHSKTIKTVALTLFASALMFGAMFVYVFWLASDHHYDGKLNPLQLEKKKIDATQHYDIVLLGDSHAELWRIHDKNVLNLGISGQTSEQIKLRYLLQKKQIRPASVLIMSVGANDVKAVSTNPETAETIADNCIKNIEFLVNDNRSTLKKIILLTIPPDFEVNFPYSFMNYEKTKKVKEKINASIRKLSDNSSVFVMDSEELFKHKNLKTLTIDGIHMNKEAYEILNKKLASMMNQNE